MESEDSEIEGSADHHRHKIRRVPYEAHPERCTGTTNRGQCMFFRIPGAKNCNMHGGATIAKQLKKGEINMLRLGVFQDRVKELDAHTQIKSVRSETSILRMALESLVSKCDSPTDLALNIGPISDIILKINKLVTSMHTMDKDLGQMIDKAQAMQIALEFSEIASRYIPESERQAQLAQELVSVVERITAPKEG